MNKLFLILIFLPLLWGCQSAGNNKGGDPEMQLEISGIYPHLAFYNGDGECGTGAVAPWADRLWTVTYGPHSPQGSADKLYEITPDLELIIRPESIGGTPANRMIHTESRQLFIGPYAIDEHRNVRVIPTEIMPGRLTGNARHLQEPERKIYCATMEEGFYEINVKTLEVTTIVPDAHELPEADYGKFLPGAHGKGLYSGQGVLVYSNNGELTPEAMKQFDAQSGALAEWDGTDWTVIRRNQFVELSGPGGISGNADPERDPIWATGWDHRSLLVGVREPGDTWSFYRLPKASHSYDGAHGWNTEWPRIRDVGPEGSPDYLMTMHGMFWRFPGDFTAKSSAGIRPRSAYLKVIGDFARWNGTLVMGCDDAAQREFLNKRKVKGNIGGPGQSNSNLWFMDPDTPDRLGPTTAEGAVWLHEAVEKGIPSDPFLFSGWEHRACWIRHDAAFPVTFSFEVDLQGTGGWEQLKAVSVEPGNGVLVPFKANETGEWIRVSSGEPVNTTVQFCYNDFETRHASSDPMFVGLAGAWQERAIGGLLYGLGNNRRTLGLAAVSFQDSQAIDAGYYELNELMELNPVDDPETERFIREKFTIPEKVVTVDESSILVVDDHQRRWRLPLGITDFTGLTESSVLRISREVVTERDLFSCHGTFYELPAENADGFAKIRPISSHPFRIHDYASFRGLLVMTGIDPTQDPDNPHIFRSPDGKAAVWAGAIDDLWKVGKPVGRGGPWYHTPVEPGQVSDPYLIGFYDMKTLEISHTSMIPILISMEVDPVGDGTWMEYKTVIVPPGDGYVHLFPDHFQARWIRFRSQSTATVTTWLDYQ
ncbi:MAG: hypothetical protein V2B15_17960 [Bacteroidota bacterium]